MKKIIALLAFCAAAAAFITAVPEAVQTSVPSASVTRPKVVSYNETVNGNGSLCYKGQTEVTSALPLVLKSFSVEPGDMVKFGDTLAIVDKDASASMIESLGQVSQLAVAAANLSTAVSLIPEKITANSAGRIISTAGDGASVESGYSIATIARTDSLIISAAVSELDIAKIKLGQKAEFVCAAYPDITFKGYVSKIASAARNQYNGAVLETVVDVYVTPLDEDPRLKSGLSAEVSFVLSAPREICVLPYEAIGQDEAGEYIYVYDNGSACRRNIFTGAEFPDGAEIVKGVSPDDVVLKEPEKISGNKYITVKNQELLSED